MPSAHDPSKGMLYAVTTEVATGQVRTRRSGFRGDGWATLGFDAPYDNGWFSAWGVDLMFDPGVDLNLRAVVVPNFGDWKSIPLFSPLADGIIDLTYSGFNDWEQMAKGACRSVANPGGTVSSPMSCF